MRAITQDGYGPLEVLSSPTTTRPGPHGRRGARRGPRRRARPRHLARHARQALPGPAGYGAAPARGAGPRPRPGGTVVEVGDRRDRMFGRRRGLRDRQGQLRRVRRGDPAKLAPNPASLTTSRRPSYRSRRPPRCRPSPAPAGRGRPAGAGHRRLRRRRHLRRAARASPSAPRSPRSPARASPTSSVRSGPRTSSTTRPTTSPTARGSTTSSSTSPATPPLKRLRRALTPRGSGRRSSVARTGSAVAGGLGRPSWGALTSPFRRQKVVMFLAIEKGADLVPITDAASSRVGDPGVDTAYPAGEGGRRDGPPRVRPGPRARSRSRSGTDEDPAPRGASRPSFCATSTAAAMVTAVASTLKVTTETPWTSTKVSIDCECSSQRTNTALPMQSVAHIRVRSLNSRWIRGRSESSWSIG